MKRKYLCLWSAHFKKLLLTVIALLAVHVFCLAQQVSAITDRNKILIGEQVELILKASDINLRTTSIISWFTIPDSAGNIVIAGREAIDTVELNGLTTYVEKYRITSFDSGRFTVLPLQIVLLDAATGKEKRFTTDSVSIEVLPVNVMGMIDYHPIKEIIEVEVKPNYFLFAAIAVSVIFLAFLLWRIFKKPGKPQHIKPVYKPAALAHAIEQIKTLRLQNLPAAGQVKLYYEKLSDICRNYFEDQLNIRSAQSTSDELMVLLSVYLQQEKKRSEFYQLLRLSDAVKFAKYIPSERQNEEVTEAAIGSLQYIDGTIREIKKNTDGPEKASIKNMKRV